MPSTPLTWAVLVQTLKDGPWSIIFTNHDAAAAESAAKDRKALRPNDVVVIMQLFAEVKSTTTITLEKAA